MIPFPASPPAGRLARSEMTACVSLATPIGRYGCQVADASVKTECQVRESGGLRCEVSGPHAEHALSEHTIRHGLGGNGYSCTAFAAKAAS